MSLYALQNFVYGCGIATCRSGGLGNCVILAKSCDVQSCSGWCWRYVLHSTGEGLIVTTIAYIIRVGGWLLWRCMWV
jgi:hypothetical protein